MFLNRILASVCSKWLAVSLITLLMVGISGSGSTAFADPSDPEATVEQPPVLPPDKPEHPGLDSRLNKIVEQIGSPGALSIAESSPISVGDLVAITVRVSHNVTGTVEFLESVGAIVANIGADYIETYTPVTALVPLSERDGVLKVSTILPPQSTVTSQGTTVHRSPIWNARGYTGTGIKVGVIDSGFNGYSALMGSELPSTVVARCYSLVGWFLDNVSFCGGSDHGTAVAEAIADIAPDVTLYIANPLSKGDLQSTAAWMVSEGVQVINMSLEWPWDGPGDGTSYHSESPLNTLDTAVDGGVIWVSAAGNEAESSWHGAYLDSDSDGNLEFVSGDETNHVYLSAGENITIYLRWDDDWGTADSDLDLSIWDYSSYSGWTKLDESNDAQNGTLGQEPIEVLSFTAPWSDTFYLVVSHESGPAPEWFQLMVWNADVEIPISDRSVVNPAESSNTGMLAVGAANWATPSTIESFSSRGPTTDGRTKPDIVGVDRGDSVSYGLGGFAGTSQASPHVAGLTALALQRFPEYTPQEVATYLKDNASGIGTVPNNTWGYGLAKLPLLVPNIPTDVIATPGVGQVTVSWNAPVDDGGSSVTLYTVTSDPGQVAVTASGLNAVVTGLTIGTNYTFTVIATNAIGTSGPSMPSNVVSPFFNTPPTANGVSASGPKDTAVLITLSGSDANGQSLTFSIASQPANGYLGSITVVDGSSATVIYAPSFGFNGVGTFTYVVNDGYDDSEAVTVTIDVGDPTAVAPASPKVWHHTTVSASPGTPVTITLQAWDVELDSLNWVIVNTVGGTAEFALGTSNVINSFGYSTMDVIFIPDAGFAGAGHVIFYVDDGNNASLYYNVARVNIAVGGASGQTSTIVSAPALSVPGTAALFFGMLGLVLVFLVRNRSRSQT